MEDWIMKKSVYLFLFSLVALVACSQTQELDIPDIPEDGFTIIALTEAPTETRTVVESGVHVYWEPGDEIAVFMGEKSAKFTTDITASSGTATFKGTFGDQGWPEELDLWAVYPFSEDAVFDGETITTNLPSEQIAREGSFGKGMNLSIAHSTSTSLQFYNVGGGIRFSVSQDGIKQITLMGKQNEPLAGQVKIKMDGDGKPVIQEVIQPKSAISLTAPDEGCFVPGEWYYFVTLPGVLQSGYKLIGETVTEGTVILKDSSKEADIKRAIFGSLKDLSPVYQNILVEGEILSIDSEQTEIPAYDWKQGDRIAVVHNGKTYLFEANGDGYSTTFQTINGQEPFSGAEGDIVYAVSPAMEITDGSIRYDNYGVFDFETSYDLQNERLPLLTMRGVGTIQNGSLHLSFGLIHSYLRIDLDKESRETTIPMGNCVRIGGVTFTGEGTFDLSTQELTEEGGTSISFIYNYQNNQESLLQQDTYSFYFAVTPNHYSDCTISVFNEYGSLFYEVSFETLDLKPNALTVINRKDESTTVSDGNFDNPPIISW